MTIPYDAVLRAIQRARERRAQRLPTVRVEAPAPNPLERIGAFMAKDEPRKVGTAETAADIFLGQLVAPFSNRAADKATEASLERYAEGGGDPGAHGNLFGAVSALGAVTGNVATSRATKPVTAGKSLVGTVAKRAAQGAAENAAAAGIGGTVFGTEEDGTRDPVAILKQMAGQAAVGAAFGALGGAIEGKRAGLPDDSPDLGSQTSGERVRGSKVFASVPDGQPAGKVDLQAAVRTRDGQTFTGPIHMLAVEEARKAGVDPNTIDSDWGYLDPSGKWVGADEAAKLGRSRHAGIIRLPGSEPEPPGTPYKAPIDEGADPRLANLAKLNLDPEAEVKVRDAYTRLGLDKRKVSWEETKAAADELGLNPRKLLDKSGRLRADEVLAVRDVISQNAKRMVDLSAEKAGAATDEARYGIQAQIDNLSEETDAFLRRYSTERTRAGRDLNALKIVARNSMEPTVWLAQAQRVKGALPLSGEEAVRITAYAQGNDRDGLIRYVSGLHQSSKLDKLLTVWKAGLLTNPLTHAVNVTSNTAMAAAESAKEVPAAAIDAVISAVRGTDRTKAVSARGLFVEQIRGMSAGAKAARRVLRFGDDPAQLAKWDFRKTNFGSGPGARLLQAYTDGVFRSLSAEDQLFKGAAMGRALEEYARLEAAKYVKEGAAKSIPEALAVLRNNLPADLVAKAMADAEVATFQQPNLVASFISKGRAGLREHGALGRGAEGASQVVMPFVRTPTNVANTLLQYSPAGFVTALVKQVGDPSQKRLAEDLGRALTGSTLVALGFMMAKEGKATGAAPTNASERAQWDLEGKQANSVRIGDRWLSVSRLAPVGALVSVGAQMYHGGQDTESMAGKIGTAAYTPLRVTLDQPFVTGVSATLDALADPGRAGERFVERQAASVVPAGVAAVARGMDPEQRDPRGILEAIASRVPVLSEQVPARLDPFGQPVPARGGVVKQMTDVTYSREASNDPLIKELARTGVTVGFPSRTRTAGGQRETRSDDEYRAFLAEVGPQTRKALTDIVTAPGYRRLSEDQQREVLESRISLIRSVASRREAAMRRRKP